MNLGMPQALMIILYVAAIGSALPDKSDSDKTKIEFGMTIIIVVVQMILLIWGGFFTTCP